MCVVRDKNKFSTDLLKLLDCPSSCKWKSSTVRKQAQTICCYTFPPPAMYCWEKPSFVTLLTPNRWYWDHCRIHYSLICPRLNKLWSSSFCLQDKYLSFLGASLLNMFPVDQHLFFSEVPKTQIQYSICKHEVEEVNHFPQKLELNWKHLAW